MRGYSSIELLEPREVLCAPVLLRGRVLARPTVIILHYHPLYSQLARAREANRAHLLTTMHTEVTQGRVTSFGYAGTCWRWCRWSAAPTACTPTVTSACSGRAHSRKAPQEPT